MRRKLTDKQLNTLISRVVVRMYKARYRKTNKSITRRDMRKMGALRKAVFQGVKTAQRKQASRRFSY